MDSFYDAPRRAPPPTPIEKFLAVPVVPEVSMICPAKAPMNDFMPYHTWKMQQHSSENRNILSPNRENILRGPVFNQYANSQNTSQLFKKQVRFESPVLQQRPSLTYEQINPRNNVTRENNCPQICERQMEGKQNKSPLNGKPFEEIYMANVPTRQLDLSIIELPKNKKNTLAPPVILEERKQELQGNKSNTGVDLKSDIRKNKENELPKTYREFLNTQKKIAKENKVDANDSITDIFNYKKAKNFNSSNTHMEGKVGSIKIDKSGNINSKQTLPQYKPPDIIKPDGCIYKYVNSVDNVEIKKPQPQIYNPIYRTSLNPSKHVDKNSYDSQMIYENCLPKLDSETQTTVVEAPKEPNFREQTHNDDTGPTNKDLLKIIAQQNEQLLILQKQVAMLLNRDQHTQSKPIEAGPQPPRTNYVGEKYVTSTQNENFRSPVQDVAGTPRKRGMSKFSIDLMTSFEVAIRPQHNKQNFVNYEPKIQEITESESVATGVESDRNDKTVVDASLHLQEPVKVREVCPTPEPSININMNDYDSSEDDEVTASEIGATFYHNLMGQVNNILKKAQVQTKGDLESRDKCKNGITSDKIKDKTMSRVKEATLKHLKSIGVSIAPIDDDSLSFGNDSKDYSPTEVSFAVKQILMKYLPDDQLAKITYKQAQSTPACKEEMPGIIPARPEFSFASVEYMKKYNLIPNNHIKPRNVDVPRAQHHQKLDGPKILDMTALKMQPKLL